MGRYGRADFDFARVSRWCALGAIVMVLWMLAPVATCSFEAFRETPLSDNNDDTPAQIGQADKVRVKEGAGFFAKMKDAVGQCYAATPLTRQTPWKRELVYALVGVAVLGALIARLQTRRSFEDR